MRKIEPVEVTVRWEIVSDRGVNAQAAHDYIDLVVSWAREHVRAVTPQKRFSPPLGKWLSLDEAADDVLKSHITQYDDKLSVHIFQHRLPGELWVIAQKARLTFKDERDAEACRRVVETLDVVRPNKYLDAIDVSDALFQRHRELVINQTSA